MTLTSGSISCKKMLLAFADLHLAKLANDSDVTWADNGTIYYNTTMNKVRIFENGQWKSIQTS